MDDNDTDLLVSDTSPKPIEEGEQILTQLSEGWAELVFDPPLRVEWAIYSEKDSNIAYVNFDFGLEYKINLTAQRNSWWGYDGVNKDSTNEAIIKAIIKFDLFHAFTHYQGDPNYTHLHWALFGNLKGQTKVVEHYD